METQFALPARVLGSYSKFIERLLFIILSVLAAFMLLQAVSFFYDAFILRGILNQTWRAEYSAHCKAVPSCTAVTYEVVGWRPVSSANRFVLLGTHIKAVVTVQTGQETAVLDAMKTAPGAAFTGQLEVVAKVAASGKSASKGGQ